MLRLHCILRPSKVAHGLTLAHVETNTMKLIRAKILFVLLLAGVTIYAQQATTLPSGPLKFGAFVARFDPGGTFTLEGKGWGVFNGTWKTNGSVVELTVSEGPK